MEHRHSDLDIPLDSPGTTDYLTTRYWNGYVPAFNTDSKTYFGERKSTRTVVWLDPKAVAKADRMLAEIPESFSMHENLYTDLVLSLLSDQNVKRDTWVHGEILAVYRHLRSHGYLKTIEAVSEAGLAGAILGLDFSSIFIVETMVHVQTNGSKAALCFCVKKCASLGYKFLDVQQRHRKNHPIARLFEESIDISSYLALLETLHRGVGL